MSIHKSSVNWLPWYLVKKCSCLKTSFLELLLLHLIGFWIVMFSLSFVLRNFLISLLISSVTCWLLRNVLFNLHVFVFLTAFFLVKLISSLIALWSEKMLDMISVFLNLLRFDLWPNIWSILESVWCALEKKVYSSVFGWNALKISMRSISFNVSFKTSVQSLSRVRLFATP